MRTTLVIDDDLYAAAKTVAKARDVSIGKALSDLARQGLQAMQRAEDSATDAMPVFRSPAGAPPITLEDVKQLEEGW